jgi:hypothetical protein
LLHGIPSAVSHILEKSGLPLGSGASAPSGFPSGNGERLRSQLSQREQGDAQMKLATITASRRTESDVDAGFSRRITIL